MFQTPVPKTGSGKRSGTGLKEWEWTHVSFCPFFLPFFLPLIFFFFYLFILNDTVSRNTVLLAVMYKTEIQNRAPDWRCVFGTHTYTQTLKRIQQIRIRISPQVLTTPTHNSARALPFRSRSLIWFKIPPALSVFVGKIVVTSTTLTHSLSSSFCFPLPLTEEQITNNIFVSRNTFLEEGLRLPRNGVVISATCLLVWKTRICFVRTRKLGQNSWFERGHLPNLRGRWCSRK